MTRVQIDLITSTDGLLIPGGVPGGETPAERRAPPSATQRGVSVGARVPAIIVAAIALAIALVAIPTWPVGVFQDDGIYVVLGKALAAGDGYRYINLPGAPHATHYPPGYPLFLALLWKLAPEFPRNVAVFTFANAGFLSLAAYATFRFARGRLGLGMLGAGAVAVAGTVSVPALSFGVFILSEPMFMALLLPVLMLAERAAERGGCRESLVAGLAGGALAMVRTTGMFVVPALVLVLALRRRWLAAIVAAAGCAVFILPWNAWVVAHGPEIPRVLVGKYGPYGAWLTDAVRTHGFPFVGKVVSRNASALYGMSWAMFTGGETSPTLLRLPAAVAVWLVFAAGLWRLARRAPVTGWFLAAYMALVIIWPFDPTRFVWALLPIFGAMLALGITAVAERKPLPGIRRLAHRAALGMCALLLVGFAAFNVRGVRTKWRDSVPRETAARATPVVEWVRAFTRPADVIAMEDDPLIYLYTGRRAIPLGTLTPEQYLEEQTYAFATETLHTLTMRYRPSYVIGATSYGVIAARTLSARTPPELRVHTLLSTAAIFTSVTP